MRGTCNEPAVMSSLNRRPFIKAAWECGMMSSRTHPWMACSPDGIAVVDLGEILSVAPDSGVRSWTEGEHQPPAGDQPLLLAMLVATMHQEMAEDLRERAHLAAAFHRICPLLGDTSTTRLTNVWWRCPCLVRLRTRGREGWGGVRGLRQRWFL